MAIEQVKAFFRQYGMEDRILEFPESCATVELAAQAIGCEPRRIAKTLSFKTAERVLLIVIAGDARVDNRKYKDRFGDKVRMLGSDEVERLTGYKIGGVCPFAVNSGVEVYIDTSLKRFDVVYPSAGGENSGIRLTVGELERYSRSLQWVDVCKGWNDPV
jgi:prolyl-tRNA editing enzyme YbaK/EbsC (Cys-tRNA(Pro) deacylase)